MDLKKVYAEIANQASVCISDEIQTGFCGNLVAYAIGQAVIETAALFFEGEFD